MGNTISYSVVQHGRIPAFRIEKLCCYLTFITGFFGSAFFTIDLGVFTLFPYRIFLLLLWGLLIVRVLASQGRFYIGLNNVKPYLIFFGIWVLYAVITLGWSESIFDAIRHIVFIFMGFSLIFFAVHYFRKPKDFNLLWWIWIGVFGILILIGFWEHLTGQHLPVSGLHEEKTVLWADYIRAKVLNMPTGVFVNPNDYATFLSLSIPFAIALMRYGKNRLAELLGLGGAIAAFYLIVMAGSRANMLAVLLELAIFLLFLTGLRQKIKVAIATAVCLAIVLVLLSGPVLEFYSKASWELSSIIFEAELTSGSVAERYNLAKNGLEFLYSTAGFGVGAGNAEYWMANYARYDTGGILNPHNWWLEILVDYGIFVFIGYVAVYIGIIRRLWCSWRKAADRKERMVAESLLLALIGFSVASISSSSIMAFNPNWMLFAFALSFLNYKRREAGGRTT